MADTFYIAGIDGGGSKTECAIVDQDGRLLGLGRGGPSRVGYVGLDVALASVAKAIDEALKEAAGISEVRLCACTHRLGSDPAVVDLISRRLGAELSGRSEGEAALGCADIFEKYGVSHIGGTGVCTWGYPRNGAGIIVGGWGIFGDEGGGYDIGLKGLRVAVRALDGRGPESVLLDRAMAHFGLTADRESFLGFAAGNPQRHLVAAFAPEVVRAAREGEDEAARIVDSAVNEHVRCILTVADRLFKPDEQFPVALLGGTVNENSIVDAVIRRVREAYPKADVRRPLRGPGHGLALFVLRELLSEGTDER